MALSCVGTRLVHSLAKFTSSKVVQFHSPLHISHPKFSYSYKTMAEEDVDLRNLYEALIKERQKVEVLTQTARILEREKEALKMEMGMELSAEKHSQMGLQSLLKAMQDLEVGAEAEKRKIRAELEKALDEAEEEIESLSTENDTLKAELARLNSSLKSFEASLESAQAQAVLLSSNRRKSNSSRLKLTWRNLQRKIACCKQKLSMSIVS